MTDINDRAESVRKFSFNDDSIKKSNLPISKVDISTNNIQL